MLLYIIVWLFCFYHIQTKRINTSTFHDYFYYFLTAWITLCVLFVTLCDVWYLFCFFLFIFCNFFKLTWSFCGSVRWHRTRSARGLTAARPFATHRSRPRRRAQATWPRVCNIHAQSTRTGTQAGTHAKADRRAAVRDRLRRSPLATCCIDAHACTMTMTIWLLATITTISTTYTKHEPTLKKTMATLRSFF